MTLNDSSQRALRPLGLHERFCTARHNVGAPPVLCYAAQLERPSIDVHTHCLRRIGALLSGYPILSCAVVDAQSRVPRFAMREVRAEDVLGPIVAYRQPSRPLEEYVAEEVHPAPCVFDDLSCAPLWRVKVHGSQDSTTTTTIVTLTIHHAINDGRGSANLFQHLLGDGDILPRANTDIAPASDSVLPLRPSLAYMLPVVFRELLLPRLPAFVQSYFTATPSWPASMGSVQLSPLSAPKAIQRIVLQDAIPALKRRGAAHGVKTINSIVFTAAIVTAYAVASQRGEGEPVKINASTAINERGAVSSLPDVGGNYVSSIDWTKTVSPTDSFWNLARQYAMHMTTPSNRTTARMNMGMLSYIPDGEWVDIHNNPTPDAMTTWETFLHAKATSQTPFGSAFEVSNLGLISFPPSANVKDVMWSQRPPFAGGGTCAFVLDVSGFEGALSVSVGWHKGTLGADVEKNFPLVLQIVLASLLDGDDTEGDELSVGVLLERIGSK